MRKIILPALITVAAIVTGAAFFIYRVAQKQGLNDQDLKAYSGAKIVRDHQGIVHITGERWLDVVEAQGFISAGERMFQMDLMRRKAAGTLSELFGKSALEFDRQQRREDWRHYANLAVERLPESQRKTCDTYARGVNRFLNQYEDRAGFEYSVLRLKPTAWSCTDTLLIVLLMSDNMSRSWLRDLEMKEWHDALPKEWFSFLFPLRHPWNRPWFGSENLASTSYSIPSQSLPNSILTDTDFKISPLNDFRGLDGSNSWAYRGKNGAWLANDPHLGYQVPQLWIPYRLSTHDGWWIVGTALPGAPGVLIGMNAQLAWSITNTGEDVDDAVIEASAANLTEDQQEIKIKGEPSETLLLQRSPLGPVVKALPGDKFVIRQWIALKPGILSIPIQELDHATDWNSFNQAIDQFKFVPLNFTMMDRTRNMGLRISGCEIVRPNNGAFAEPSDISQWADDCSIEHRHKLFIPYDNGADTAFISTANEQIWVDDHLHNWSDDDRAQRIRETLTSSPDLNAEDMRLLQLDTTSKFHKDILRWLIDHGTTSFLTTEQKNDWQTWDGNIRSCPLCMSEAADAALLLDQIIIRTVQKHFNKSGKDLPFVKRNMERMRVVQLIESSDAVKALGLNSNKLATGILKDLARVQDKLKKPWHLRNHWASQHPFVGRIPIIGDFFRVDDYPQFGASSVLLAEKPLHGPSTRIIWDPADPKASTWSFPLGLSGHPFSKHYKDWSKLWQQGGTTSIPSDR